MEEEMIEALELRSYFKSTTTKNKIILVRLQII
jgi:hypothetical protein